MLTDCQISAVGGEGARKPVLRRFRRRRFQGAFRRQPAHKTRDVTIIKKFSNFYVTRLSAWHSGKL
jgi:hypothetical protein